MVEGGQDELALSDRDGSPGGHEQVRSGLPSLAAWPRERTSLLLVSFLVFYVGLHVVAFASPRFRLPILHILFLMSGRTLARGWRDSARELGAPGRARAAVLAAILLGCVAVTAAETLRDPAFTSAEDSETSAR